MSKKQHGQSIGTEILEDTVIFYFRVDEPHKQKDIRKYEEFYPRFGIYKDHRCPACAADPGYKPASESRIFELLSEGKDSQKRLFGCGKGHRFSSGCWRGDCAFGEAGTGTGTLHLTQLRKILPNERHDEKDKELSFHWKSFCVHCNGKNAWTFCPDCDERLSKDSLKHKPCTIPVPNLSRDKGFGSFHRIWISIA